MKIVNEKQSPSSVSCCPASSYRDMEASLLHFVFYIAPSCLTEIPQHFGKNPFESVVLHFTASALARVVYGLVAVLRNVECRTVKVAGVVRCIDVPLLQFANILTGAQHTGDKDFVKRYAFYIQ